MPATTATDDQTQPAMGDNSGVIDLALLLDTEQIARALREQYAPKITRRDDLLAGFARFEITIRNGINDDATQAKASDFARQLGDEAKAIEALRETAKRPITEAGRAVDAFFKRELAEPLLDRATKVRARMTTYAQAKQAREREEALAAQRRAQAEAQRLADEAEAARLASAAAVGIPEEDPNEAMDRAIAAEQEQMARDQAARRAMASTAKVTSDLGSTSSLRSRRVWALTDIKALVAAVAAGDVPINVLMPNKAILDAMARDKDQEDLPGLVFSKETKIAIR